MTKPKEIAAWPIGRPVKPPPKDAAKQIQDLAADGWSIVGIAAKLGTTHKTFQRWLQEDEELLDAFNLGRERERRALHNNAYRLAFEAKEEKTRLTATMFLLNSRHQYRSDINTDQSGRSPTVVINLPGAKPMSDYIEVSNADGSECHRIPATNP